MNQIPKRFKQGALGGALLLACNWCQWISREVVDQGKALARIESRVRRLVPDDDLHAERREPQEFPDFESENKED